MKFGIYCIDDIFPEGKTVFCRLDLNSPLNSEGWPLDIYRIERALPTIIELSLKGAKLVLMTHQGGDLEYHNYGTTENHARIITEKTGIAVKFIDDVCGPAAREMIRELEPGKVLMLDNVRYMAEELTLFETKLNLNFQQQAETIIVKKLSPLADYFVCDAFAAAHRSQPTLTGFPCKLPSLMGRLFEEEMTALEQILHRPARPSTFLLGGSKVQDAFMIMEKALAEKMVDQVLTAGLVANIMLIASGKDIGNYSRQFLVERNLLDYIGVSQNILSRYKSKIILPLDLAFVDHERKEISVENLPIDHLIVDLGCKTVNDYSQRMKNSGTVFINGPAGVYEEEASLYGTKELWEAAVKSGAYTVVGGGDSVSVVNKFQLLDKFSYVCTGGGAMVRYLSGENLPVVKSLRDSTLQHPL